MIHELKTWPKYYLAIIDGNKNFEVRKADRDFKVGDTLLLQEYDPEKKEYTGEEVYARVTYILQGGNFGIEEGYVVMGIQDRTI